MSGFRQEVFRTLGLPGSFFEAPINRRVQHTYTDLLLIELGLDMQIIPER